jgi:hypothetical protein
MTTTPARQMRVQGTRYSRTRFAIYGQREQSRRTCTARPKHLTREGGHLPAKKGQPSPRPVDQAYKAGRPPPPV